MEKHFFVQNKLVTLPNVFKFLVLNFGIARSRTTATTKYPLNSRCPSCWRHTSVFFCGLITSNLAGIYRASMAQSPLKIEKQCNYKHILIGVRRVVALRIASKSKINIFWNIFFSTTQEPLGLLRLKKKFKSLGLVLWSSDVDQMCSDIRLSDFI